MIDDEVLLASLIGPPEASRESLAESKHNVSRAAFEASRQAVEHPHHSLARTVAPDVLERTKHHE